MNNFYKYRVINDIKYVGLPLLPVLQKGETFYVSKIPASVLVKSFVVHPTIYDIKHEQQLIEAFPDEEEVFRARIDSKNRLLENLKKKGYQRDVDPQRVKSISSFLESEEVAFFPNAIILTCELINEYAGVSSWGNVSDDDFSTYPGLAFLDEESLELYIPCVESSLLVVDGQHRIEGIKAATTIIEDYDILVSFIIGYERSVIASLFYTINYEQKNVNKSVLYHLKAEFSHEIDEITFLHELIRLMNEGSKSPFGERIKMLGKTPKNISRALKTKMTVSQAFLIDSLWYTLAQKVTRSKFLPIFRYYYNCDNGVAIAKYFSNFFKAVRELRSDWDNPENSQMSKSLGVGALIKVMNDIFAEQFVREGVAEDPSRIENFSKDIFMDYLDGLQDLDLQPYSKTSSAGGIGKMVGEIYSVLSIYQGEPDNGKAMREEANNNLRNWLKYKL